MEQKQCEGLLAAYGDSPHVRSCESDANTTLTHQRRVLLNLIWTRQRLPVDQEPKVNQTAGHVC
jgi:hypothetical protein